MVQSQTESCWHGNENDANEKYEMKERTQAKKKRQR